MTETGTFNLGERILFSTFCKSAVGALLATEKNLA